MLLMGIFRLPFRNSTLPIYFCACLLLLGLLLVQLLSMGAGPSVVVYTALDQDFSQPVFEEFTRQTGIDVLAKYDTESTKTVGLTQALFAERERPRCDLFWNNEIVNTLRLDQAGLLAGYASPAAAAYPEAYRSRQHTWHGFAARARVLIVNTELVAPADEP
ncbi:MAG: extracellular solute-binding protein, partial [Bythopirellula sp.]